MTGFTLVACHLHRHRYVVIFWSLIILTWISGLFSSLTAVNGCLISTGVVCMVISVEGSYFTQLEDIIYCPHSRCLLFMFRLEVALHLFLAVLRRRLYHYSKSYERSRHFSPRGENLTKKNKSCWTHQTLQTPRKLLETCEGKWIEEGGQSEGWSESFFVKESQLYHSFHTLCVPIEALLKPSPQKALTDKSCAVFSAL